MFEQRRNKTLFSAAFTTLALIYHQTAHNLRTRHSNPIYGLIEDIMQAMFMTLAFVGMYWLIGVKRTPIRGDNLLFIMSGMFIYMTHVKAVGAAGAGSATSAILKHQPINTAILFLSSALASLYNQILAVLVMLLLYHVLGNPISIEYPVGALFMLLLAWFYGLAVGVVVLAIRPWWPLGARMAMMVYQRASMVASGKMFAANAMPGFLLAMFDWNPLFHIIDQTRGFVFVNYTPHHSTIGYAVVVALAVLMVGLMGEFVTRNSQSLSWANRAT